MLRRRAVTESEELPPETGPEPPGNVAGVLRITAEAEVIPGPETLAQQAAAEADDQEQEPQG
jgi:hypothetical protein